MLIELFILCNLLLEKFKLSFETSFLIFFTFNSICLLSAADFPPPVKVVEHSGEMNHGLYDRFVGAFETGSFVVVMFLFSLIVCFVLLWVLCFLLGVVVFFSVFVGLSGLLPIDC